MSRYDAIVLGIGGVGSAALYHLAKRGARVVGIDRFDPPHDRGSSHGHTRVIRQAYFEHPDYVPLLVDSYRGWNELEASFKRMLFHQIGLLEFGPPDGVVVPGVMRAAQLHGIPVEPMTAAQIMRRWPGFSVPDNLTGVFEPNAGYLLVEDCVRAHLDGARAAGADVVTNTEVVAWTGTPGEVRVSTAGGEFVADRLVIAAGAWAWRLLAHLNVPLQVRRKSLFWFATDRAEYEQVRGCPEYFIEPSQGVYFYGFPKLDARGVKVAEHSGGHDIEDPLKVDRSIDSHERQRLVDALRQFLPGVSENVTDHVTCLYTMSPDEHFIVDQHPSHPNVVFAAGLSGHGFKFTTTLGKILAELTLDGGTNLPIEFLSLARFTANKAH